MFRQKTKLYFICKWETGKFYSETYVWVIGLKMKQFKVTSDSKIIFVFFASDFFELKHLINTAKEQVRRLDLSYNLDLVNGLIKFNIQ